MLQDLLLLFIVIAGGAYGLYLMRGVDHFIKKNREEEAAVHSDKRRECAVIFSDSGAPELEEWFSDAGFRVVSVSGIYLPEECRDARYLVALGSSDVDNLSVCNVMKQVNPKAEIYSLCNDRSVKKLYRKAGASVVYNREELMQRMELIILGHEVGAA